MQDANAVCFVMKGVVDTGQVSESIVFSANLA